MAKDYDLIYKIGAEISKQFNASFANASASIREAAQSINDLNRKASNIDSLVKQRDKTVELGKKYRDLALVAKEMQDSIKNVANPSTEMINTQSRLAAKAEQARIEFDKSRVTLASLSKQYDLQGLSVDKLLKKKEAMINQVARLNKINSYQARIDNLTQKQQIRDTAGVNSIVMASAIGHRAFDMASGPIKQAMAIEDSMAEINKVVDFKEPDGLKNMQAALQDMSLKIPLTAEGLMQITAAAGQAGIAENELLSFTESAAKMGVAFDMTADAAGEMMAKWRSGMGLTQDQVVELADATNALSNANAATGKQIGETLKRYGALGKVAGLTEKQTAALAATAIGAGAEAEVAATGINAFMRALVKGDSMTKSQREAFEGIGYDPQALQKSVKADAPKAILEVLERIKKVSPEQQMSVLTNLFGEEGARALGPMLSNTEQLEKNFALVADKSNYADSMLKEFQSRSTTTSNALVLAQNAASYFASMVGQPLLEPLKEVITKFVEIGKVVGDWMKANQGLVRTLTLATTAIGGTIIAFHAIRAAVMFSTSPFFAIAKGVLQVQKTLVLMGPAISTATTAFKTFAIASKVFLLSPMGLVVTGIVAAVAAGYLLYKNWDVISAKLSSLWSTFSEKFPGIASILTTTYENYIKPVVDNMKGVFQGLTDFVSGVFSGNWERAWQGIVQTFSSVVGSIGSIFKAPLNAIIDMINGVIAGMNNMMSVKLPDWLPGGGKELGVTIPQIPRLAEGGVVSSPTLAMIGEGREPEVVMPLSTLPQLGNNTAPMPSVNVNFAPVINLSGSGNVAQDLQRGLQAGKEDLKRELERLLNAERRLSYT